MEVSFTKEIKCLRLGAGDTFHGEGILAITKALLQSGVAYVGGYQGAPVSHLLDVMVQAKPYMQELGVQANMRISTSSCKVARLNRDINKILPTQAVKDRITALSGEALPLTPQEFGNKATDDSKRFGALIKERKIIGD